MDRKGIAILVVAFGLMVSWPWMVTQIYPPKPVDPASTNKVAQAAASGTAAPAASSTPAPVAAVAAVAPPQLGAGAPEQTLVLENDKVRATFSSLGGGLKHVELKDYRARIHRSKEDPDTELAALNKPAFVPAFTHVNTEALTGDGVFGLSRIAGGIRAEKTLAGGLKVVKEFRLTTNFQFQATVRIENIGGQPVAVPAQELVIGTGSPMDPHETPDQQGAHWFNGEKAEHFDSARFSNATLGCIPGTPFTEIQAGNTNVLWASVHNRFFTLIAVPEKPADRLVVRDYPLIAPSKEQMANDGKLNPKPEAYQAAFLYPAATLAPGAVLERKYEGYAGPKEYFTLSRLDPQLDLVMDLTGFTGFFAKGLLLSLNGLHQFIPSYGWCIIAITVIIKGLFWPLTAASTRSMKRMQAIQPQLAAVKEKYKDNPSKLNEQTLKVMKDNKVNPAAGCLPMLIQFPVFIGFFFMLRTAIELRGESFLWAWDLSQPDTLFVIPGLGFFPFLGVAGVGLPVNLLPLLMGCTSLYLASLTPMSPQMDPAQQKMMKYMPVFFTLFLYNYSSGLTLYWTVQNLITILQTKLTKMNADKQEPAASAGPTSLLKRKQ